ncbi:RING finger domain protein [Paecilomyces variotii No. 5]|uniref:RING finger domain protein n=1 Tax=Byssochlamys spectabilis (strain No. 5 / NBRC 109023) TaxID=1356009 RepID=V5I186_BYSSN|nr:RING finger domain protein [Paecilomyces variotii No. 5]
MKARLDETADDEKCLTSWFSSGRSSKTCPDCRALVKALPAPAYLVRAIVQMFTSRAELLEKGETTAQHKENRQEEAERLETDKANSHPRTGGLFQGSFKERPPVHRPIYDVEDNVNRCPICQWELEDTGCHHCGYGLDVETLTESEENSEMTDYIDDLEDGFGDLDEDLVWNDVYDGVPFEELPFGLQQFHGGRPRMPHHHHHHHDHPLLREAYAALMAPSISTASRDDSDSEDEDEDEDEEEDDFGEMDSFIDDDEGDEDESDSDRSTVVGDHDYTAHSLPLDDLEDEGSDVPMSQDAEDADDYYEDSSEDEDPIRPPVTGNSRRTVQSGSVGSISGSRLRRRSSLRDAGVDTNGSSRFFREENAARNTQPEQQQWTGRPAPAGLSVNNAIPVDDDDSDDDAPVRPTRRNRNRTATRRNQQLDLY